MAWAASKIGVLLGVGAGVLFGVAFTLTVGDVGGGGAVAGADPACVGLAVPRSRCGRSSTRRRSWRCSVPARKWAIGSGLAAGVALGSLKLGYIKGSAGPVSVAASQFAAVAVLLSVIFNKERLRTWQAIGVAASGVGVALMALG